MNKVEKEFLAKLVSVQTQISPSMTRQISGFAQSNFDRETAVRVTAYSVPGILIMLTVIAFLFINIVRKKNACFQEELLAYAGNEGRTRKRYPKSYFKKSYFYLFPEKYMGSESHAAVIEIVLRYRNMKLGLPELHKRYFLSNGYRYPILMELNHDIQILQKKRT